MDTRQDERPLVAPGDSSGATVTVTVAEETSTDSERENARKRIKRRRDLQGGAVAYVVINAFLVGVWAVTGGGYFWPGWVLAGWGVGMVLGVWDYFRSPVTERDIDEEIDRNRRGGVPT